nr:reverse transcriptase domain-containing protein [Tanacetum cinerariifolium]
MLADIAKTFDNLRRINMKLNPKKCSFGVTEGKFLGYMVTSEGIRANPAKTKDIAEMQSPRTWGKYITKENNHDYRWTEEAENAFQELKKMVLELPALINPLSKETLFVYLAASQKVMSAVLLVVREGRQHPVHYILADFINEVPVGSKAMVPRQTSCTIDHDRERKEEWILYTDGAAGAKGSGAGLVLISPTKMEYMYALQLNFKSTNNQAKYKALLAGLRITKKIEVQSLFVNVDSKLVASQVNGSYEACKENMIRYLNKAKEYIGCFKLFKIQNKPRNKNQKADVLSKLASVAFNHLTKEILVETLDVPSMDVEEINVVVEEEGETWMTPIINCLESGIWPEDQNETCALRIKISQYIMQEGLLFKRSYLMPMLRWYQEPKFLIKMSPMRSEGEELEYPFFEGDGLSFDEWRDYGVAGDDYEGPLIFNDDQFEDEFKMRDDAFLLIGKEVAPNSEILKAMFPLLEEFSDVFHDELPYALPPLCDIQHHIDLEPSSQFPNRPHYRLCPGEHEELRRQVEEFVSKVQIHKIMSMCAQPRGPLDLMSLHVSGSVPKKVQDFIEGLPYHSDSSVDDLVGNSRTNFVYPWGNDTGLSVKERALLFLEA